MNDLERLQKKIDRLEERIQKPATVPPVIGTVPDSRPQEGWPTPTDGADTPSAPPPDHCGLCGWWTLSPTTWIVNGNPTPVCRGCARQHGPRGG